MNDNQIEQEIQAKGLTAPRVKTEDIEANIADEFYFTADNGVCGSYREMVELGRNKQEPVKALSLLTFCVLLLKNGFTVTGESACASPENFDADIGRKIARAKAVEKIWPLMGYELRSKLAAEQREEAFRQHALDVQSRLSRIQRGDSLAAFVDTELVYAASARCMCGAGMAYPVGIGTHGSWHCSDILTLRALTKGQDGASLHTPEMPFAFYEVKSESQPSARGATTRPAPASHVTADGSPSPSRVAGYTKADIKGTEFSVFDDALTVHFKDGHSEVVNRHDLSTPAGCDAMPEAIKVALDRANAKASLACATSPAVNSTGEAA